MRLNGFWKDIPIRGQIKTERTEKNTNERTKGTDRKKRAEREEESGGAQERRTRGKRARAEKE